MISHQGLDIPLCLMAPDLTFSEYIDPPSLENNNRVCLI
jgi:hypothetical protein